ncbi:ABC transporter substrate-binding protein [Demetria terragena]|uniref:ABC transporter substrate-binding protein n=1 Tax=Demetria terragena TaxID=63959 RepID=UPI000372713C|nr:ABC transporter substrate-binding protein [Demetria terragena]
MVNRRAAAVAAASAVALTLASCASSDRDSESKGSGDKGGGGGTLTFGAAGAPATFDPFYASDGETFRITRQITEGLVGFKPGTPDLAPELATKWTPSKDGKTWVFDLREGVKFSDGTKFDADAVCKNFERMFDQNAAGQTASNYWVDNMGGYKSKDAKSALYQGCTAKSANQVEIKLLRSTSRFPALLGLPSFSMQSPTAMDKYKANDIKAQGDGFTYSDYANKHVTGTGPFKFDSYDEANKTVTLVRNEDYYGDKAKIAKLVFKIIPNETSRKQALQAGTIDGYDLPNPVDWPQLKKKFNLEIRDPFNILYLGFNAKVNPDLKDLKVRQALAYGINRAQFVKTQLPEGAEVANQWYPDTVDGYNKDATKYDYNPTKAKALLKEAGKAGLKIKLWYPSEVSRPYMPDPQKVFQAVKSDWEKIGVKVEPVTKPWNGGYITSTDNGQAEAFFLGWTGDYNTPDNFIANFFGSPAGGFQPLALPNGAEMVKRIGDADGIVDKGQRTAAYKKLGGDLMSKYMPGVPISHSPPAIVFTKAVTGVVPSPLTSEDFSTAVIEK